tara:strand:+ start:119 stop:283 length:165 start_codon:yes stop_codon:yes gene_type:complete
MVIALFYHATYTAPKTANFFSRDGVLPASLQPLKKDNYEILMQQEILHMQPKIV